MHRIVVHITFNICLVVDEKMTKKKIKIGEIPTLNITQESNNAKIVTPRPLTKYQVVINEESFCYKDLKDLSAREKI